MKTKLQKIFLLTVMFSLSVLAYAEMQNNSILRFESTNQKGEVVYAVAMSDGSGSVVAMTAADSRFVLENSLWLAHGNDNGFTIQNLGTGKFLNQGQEKGTKGDRHFLKTDSESEALSLHRDNTGYYWQKGGTSIFNRNDLYIQYDPNLGRWFFYSSGTGFLSLNNKGDSQQNGDFKWEDSDEFPISSEANALEIKGSDVAKLIGASGNDNLKIDQIKNAVVETVGKKDAEAAAGDGPSVITVGDATTYPVGIYWKNGKIYLPVNSSDWTPVSFPVKVKCTSTNLNGVGYQTFNSQAKANGKSAWVTKNVTSGLTFEKGVAYHFATDGAVAGTPIEIEFEPVSESVSADGFISVEKTYQGSLGEVTGTSVKQNYNWHYIGNALFKNAGMSSISKISRYNKSTGKWDEVNVANKAFEPFAAFFVQYNGSYSLEVSSAAVQETAPKLAREKSATEEYYLRIEGEGEEDQTGIFFEEDASAEGYVIGEDFLSFATKGRSFTEIYTHEEDIEFSFNTRPMENTFVKVGLYVGKAGRYTISLDNISGNAESMVLYDNYEQDFARLHLGETYTFDSERGSFDDRFAVAVTYAPGTTTENVSLEAVNLVVVGNEIQGVVEGAGYAIYNSTGSLVYSDVAYAGTVTLPNLNSGVYIVRTTTGWTKFVVK